MLGISLALALVSTGRTQQSQTALPAGAERPRQQHNVVLFITDGLRHDSVSEEYAPTMFSLRKKGVDFINSHSLYPTFTTPNASAFATGHLLGDTGDFGNALYVGQPLRGAHSTTLTPFIENDSFLAELNKLYQGNYLQEETLMSLARRNGYSVATVGKLGPTAIQDIEEVQATTRVFQSTSATIVDDATGLQGIPLPPDVKAEMNAWGFNVAAPDRSNGQVDSKGNNGRSGTLAANWNQQQYLTNAVTQAILPAFKKAGKPFLLVFWSRDPDGTQHNQGDGLDQLVPGINGPTAHAGVRNADTNLWQIMEYLKANNLDGQTDIIVAADHGFSTISRREIDRQGRATTSYAATKAYAGVKEGYLPPGFLAIDLAHALKKPLFDLDAPVITTDGGSVSYYQPLDDCDGSRLARHPSGGSGLIGGSGRVPEGNSISDAEIIVAANGGSDLIYLPQENAGAGRLDANKRLARTISEFLLQQDYVDGIFVRDDLGDLPGTLPMSAIGLMGATRMPKPAMVVNFKSFSLGPGLLTRVEIADTTLQEGQGMHGTFSRADTFNNMIATGPDFKTAYVDSAPSSNADLAVTIAHILGWKFADGPGKLRGRVLAEAIQSGPDAPAARREVKVSTQPGPGGARTVLQQQTVDGHTYFDQGCLVRSAESKECN